MSPESEALRGRVVAIARGWIGTPYRHQGRRRAVGCDCLGLVVGVWGDLYGSAPAHDRSYAADWGEAGGREMLLDGCRRYATPKPIADCLPGDVMAFRLCRHLPAKHLAIMASPGTIIHTRQGHAVCEDALIAWWWRRLAGVFAFPISASLSNASDE